MLLEDLILLSKNLSYIPTSMIPSSPSDLEFREKFSEMSITKGTRNKLTLMKKVIFGEQHSSHQVIHWNNVGCDVSSEWFFINGVCTTKEIAELNIEAISSLFNVKVTALYNPTDGFVKDIIESVRERTFDKYAAVTEDLLDRILNATHAKKSIKIIVHSQGGIIMSNILKRLKEINGKYNIELYTFASAADEDIDVRGIYQEHFCNEYDFVARMGLLNEVTSGVRYVKQKTTGHFLNRDYLEHFKHAKYCNGESRLYGYLK